MLSLNWMQNKTHSICPQYKFIILYSSYSIDDNLNAKLKANKIISNIIGSSND